MKSSAHKARIEKTAFVKITAIEPDGGTRRARRAVACFFPARNVTSAIASERSPTMHILYELGGYSMGGGQITSRLGVHWIYGWPGTKSREVQALLAAYALQRPNEEHI